MPGPLHVQASAAATRDGARTQARSARLGVLLPPAAARPCNAARRGSPPTPSPSAAPTGSRSPQRRVTPRSSPASTRSSTRPWARTMTRPWRTLTPSPAARRRRRTRCFVARSRRERGARGAGSAGAAAPCRWLLWAEPAVRARGRAVDPAAVRVRMIIGCVRAPPPTPHPPTRPARRSGPGAGLALPAGPTVGALPQGPGQDPRLAGESPAAQLAAMLRWGAGTGCWQRAGVRPATCAAQRVGGTRTQQQHGIPARRPPIVGWHASG